MKNVVGVLLMAGTLQGCMAAVPLVGVGITAGGVAHSKRSTEKHVEWAGKMSRMNCSQLRTELVRLEKKKNILTAINPISTTGSEVASVKSTMHMRGCRMPA